MPLDLQNDDGLKSKQVEISDLVSKSRSIGTSLYDRKYEAAQRRSLPEETINDLLDTKILRACMPKKFGGFELPFGAHTEVALELSKYCGSTAWVAAILGSHNWWLGKFQPESQYEVWDENKNSLIGAAFASKKGANCYRKNGGFVVNGTWMWCSAAEYCDWVALMVPLINENEEVDLSMVLLKKGEFKVNDVWHSPGLRATGSNDIEVSEVFVPNHRITKLADLNSKNSPGCDLNKSSVYKLPMLEVFGYSVAIPTLGTGMATLKFFLNEMDGRTSFDNSKILEFQSQQLRIAKSSVELDSALLIYRNDLNMMWDAAESDRELCKDEILKIKRNCAYVSLLSKSAASRVIESMGASGIKDSNPAYTSYADTIAGGSHRALSWDINASLWGKHMFGFKENENEIDRRKSYFTKRS